MAELGIIASVVAIADTGLRLSIKLYTFGEIVSTADKSVISISKDVSLTSSVLKELGSLLENDAESHIFSKNAVQTADTVVKECLEVFQEMESILVKKLPSLSGQDGIREGGGGKKSKATALLERMKWGYLQPKLQLLRSNLDRLKSTLLLMLNVITYARQVAGKSEPPSVIEDQRSLIEDLAKSNQDYIRRFEQMKLGIQNTAETQQKDAQSDRTGGGIESEREQITQKHVHSKGNSMSPERAATASVNINNMYINTNVQGTSIPRGFEKTKQSRKAQELGSEENKLFSHLKHYLSLVNSLLDEVDEIKYEIRIDSRDRVRTDICQAYQREMKELDASHESTKMVLAEKHLAPLVAGVKRRLEQVDGPNPGGQEKKMSTGVLNGGSHQIPQPQPESSAMQLGLEGIEDSYSMPFNNGLSDPYLPMILDHEEPLKITDGGDPIFAEPLFGRSFKARENTAPATDAITTVDQHDEAMENSVPAEDQDTGIRPPDSYIIMPRPQYKTSEASPRRRPDQQLQRNHLLPIQHQQGRTQLNKTTPNAPGAATSGPSVFQGPNDCSPASAHHLSHYGDSNTVTPQQSAPHPMRRSAQQQVPVDSGYSNYLPLPSIGVSQQMAPMGVPYTQQQQAHQHHAAQHMALPNTQQQQPQQHHAAQHMAFANTQQRQAQPHHAPQQFSMAPSNTQQQQAQQQQWMQQNQQIQQQQQQQQRMQQNQRVQQQQQQQQWMQRYQQVQQQQVQQQQHANVSGDYQMHQTWGNDQAKKSLSQAQSVRGAPQPSLSRYQSAAPLPTKTEEPPQKKRGRPSREEHKLRIHEVPAPITTFGSRHQARPLLRPLHTTADGSGNLTGNKAQSNEQGPSPTSDDPMQEGEAAVVGAPGSATSPEHGSVAVGFQRQCPDNDTYSGSNDAQAKVLAAQRIAVEKDVTQRMRVRSRRTRRLQQAPRSQVHSGERDIRGELLVDYGAGSAGHVHNGNREDLPPGGYGYPDEVDGVGRPFTATRSSQRSDTVGGGTDIRSDLFEYPIPWQGDVNTIPSAQVDMTGAGGLVEVDAQSQRFCYESTGNEATLIRSPPIASETDANQARRVLLQQHQRHLRAGTVHGHDPHRTPLPKSNPDSSHRSRKPFVERERNVNPISGHEMIEDGEVRSEDGESLGVVTDGHRPMLVGLEIDDNGYVVDNEGNKVGDSTLMQSHKEPEDPTKEETVAAHDADIAKEIKPNESKHMHAMRRPRGPGGRFLAAKEESLNEEGKRKEAQVPHTVADSRPQMSSIERLEPTVTQLRRYIKTLPEAPLQQSQHLTTHASFSTSNQVSPPDNSMFQYNKATDSWWDNFELAKMEHPAAIPAGSPILSSEKSSKASLKRDLAALNGEPIMRVKNTVAAHKGRAGASKNSPDGKREKPQDNENGSSDASQSAHDEKDSTTFNASSLGSRTGEISQVPRAEVNSNGKGQTGDLGPPNSVGGFTSRRCSFRYMGPERSHSEPSAQEGSANQLRPEGASRSQYSDTSAVQAAGLSSLEPTSEPPRTPINHSFARGLKRPWQAQTPPLGLNENGMEDEVPRDEGANLALDDINTDLDLDLDLCLDNSPTTPDPSRPGEEEEDDFRESSVPVAGKAGNVVDELVTLWTLLPVG